MLHMAWFVGQGYSVHGWQAPWSGRIDLEWMRPDIYLDLARALDRAGFDYIMLEDGLLMPDSYGGTPEWFLKNAWMVPKADPMALVPLIGQATTRIGIVATMTTSFTPPFTAARLGATLDHLTDGRFGFNIVTAHNERSAQNFGLDEHYEHDLRYEMADEWMDVVDALWSSWEDGAIVADADGGTFADVTKVHPIDHAGRFYKCRGPLNVAPGPQRRPVICQAGGSPAGRGFASRHADTILARYRDADAAKAFRDDIRARMAAHGRDPDDCKILYLMTATLAETDDLARARFAHQGEEVAANFEHKLAFMSYASGKDFSKLDLDAPLPEIRTNAAQASTKALTAGSGKTLREIASENASGGFDFVGSPDTVAAQMEETARAIGGDGFLISNPLTRHAVAEVADGLAPALARRGLLPAAMPARTLRQRLRAF
ncbi:FMNH2-dependent monooxygenase [Acuticoccus sediminis]|uniref:FMNH2-dependent monooxygenase n=1 Tax=Acuticoccus sediminis TaxID=2184697 RepID=A0A8B2NZX1_9HYPH|nr:NtaA/DmoA family FMN-dependent monooxygenase [Acuticoccus sediminis]RAI04270.1 FMNH2-dependent monooxygenase [Acuticoccus sediminis]